MKNIFLLPTDKPSRLAKHSSGSFHIVANKSHKKGLYNMTNQNIYITSSEEIKYNDYYLGEDGLIYCLVTTVNSNGKKIILTTDQELIKDGVQSIEEDFLQWFVKNPSCEEVVVKSQHIDEFGNYIDDCFHSKTDSYVYKIIISKEEIKQEPNFYEKLKEHFENTPREKILEDWNKSADLDKVGPTVDEFLKNSDEERLKENGEKWSLNSAKEFALSYFKKSDEVSSKGMFTYELLLRILEAGIECGYKFGIKRQDERMFTYDELRRIAYNAYCLGQLEEPTENKYNLWIQQFKKK
jgi:hypothetical protein